MTPTHSKLTCTCAASPNCTCPIHGGHRPATDQGKRERCFAVYRDDGPVGPCGQMVSVTSPWNKLLVYEGPDAESDCRALYRFLAGHHNFAGRRNARIEAIYSDYDENIEAGWMVPETDRV